MNKQTIQKRCRKNERGAALVSVILISLLLLAAGSVLLLEASMNTVNVTDATAEQQAYYAAESGIQATINVLRGNVPPSPLFDTLKPATDPVNRIDFKKAINLAFSNSNGDGATNARLSRWLTYSTTSTDRVTLGLASGATYDPLSGFAYNVTVSDPDNTTGSITFRTSGSINGAGTSIIIGSGGNTATVTYNSKPTTTLNVSGGSTNTDFGNFTIVKTGSPTGRMRFVITVFMTAPYNTTKEIRGYIEAGSGSVNFLYDSKSFDVSGSTMTLVTNNNTPTNNTDDDTYISLPNATTRRFGFLNSGVEGNNILNGSMTPAEPIRLLVRSTGFGPRNARKQLEAVVQKNFFNGLSSPATLLLVGSDNGCAVFNPGSSSGTEYSGNDVASTAYLPPVGTTDNAILSSVNNAFYGNGHPFNGDVIGEASNVSGEMPFWLQSATNLHSTLMDLKSVAQSSGRYFPVGVNPTTAQGVGNVATAKGITYKEGDFSYSGDGGGILVVTGKLTLNGAFNFNGLIIVTGANGVERNGGGNGTLQGNIIVAPYNSSNLAGGFLCPKYDLNGGGNSTIVYNSSSVANGQTAVSNFVLGVAEK